MLRWNWDKKAQKKLNLVRNKINYVAFKLSAWYKSRASIRFNNEKLAVRWF